MRTFVLMLALMSIAGRLNAAEQKAPAPEVKTHPPAPEVKTQTPALEVKTKSSFKMDNGSRSPFWPIGFKPTAKISHTDTDQAGTDIPPTAFSVTSITLGAGGHFAIINGKIMGEGQQFGLQIGSQTYQITVKAIEDGQVILSRRDREIAVPLRRK